jgi:hypothetical protein
MVHGWMYSSQAKITPEEALNFFLAKSGYQHSSQLARRIPCQATPFLFVRIMPNVPSNSCHMPLTQKEDFSLSLCLRALPCSSIFCADLWVLLSAFSRVPLGDGWQPQENHSGGSACPPVLLFLLPGCPPVPPAAIPPVPLGAVQSLPVVRMNPGRMPRNRLNVPPRP